MFSYVSILNPGFTTVANTGNLQAGTLGYVSFLNPPSTAGGTGGGAAISAGTNSRNSGTVVFSNSNNVSFGMDTAGVVTASASAAAGAGAAISAGTSSQGSGTVVFADSNGVSFGLSNGTLTFDRLQYTNIGMGAGGTTVGGSSSNGNLGSAPAKFVAFTNIGLALDATAGLQIFCLGAGTGTSGTNATFTLNSNGLAFNGSAYLTTAAQVSHSHAFATTTTNGSNVIVATSNSNGVTLAVPPFITAAAGGGGVAIAYSNVTQTSGTLVLSGSNGITVRSALNTAIIEFDGHHLDAVIPSGNGFGTGFSSMTSGTIGLIAGSNVSFSQNGNNLTIQAATNALTTAAQVSHSHGNGSLALTNLSGTTASASNGFTLSLSAAAPGAGGGPTLQGSGTYTQNSGTIQFANSNGVTFGLSNNGVMTASAAAGGAPNRSYIEIMNGERLTRPWNISATQFSNRPIFQPFWLDGAGLIPSTVRVFWSWVTNTHPPIVTMGAAFYEMANSTQLTRICSTTQTLNFATTQSAQYTGNRAIDITGMTDSLGEGRKVLALIFSGANASNMNASIWGGDNFPNILGYIAGGNATSATNNTLHVFPFWGVYTANSGSFPASIGATQINGGRSADLMDIYAVVKEL